MRINWEGLKTLIFLLMIWFAQSISFGQSNDSLVACAESNYSTNPAMAMACAQEGFKTLKDKSQKDRCTFILGALYMNLDKI